MTEHFVTLFDSGFLPQGIALHTSLERHSPDYRLWIIAMDAEASTALHRLGLSNVTIVDLAEIETPELLGVKADRTRGEYCWTLTPFTPDVVFARAPEAGRATYLDADLWFRENPRVLLDHLERSGASSLITDHGYSADYDQSAQSGRFCVQFMPFVRGSGEPVLRWWQERVIEWCYARIEDGRFGDQKYLDDWPRLFAGLVEVLADESLTQAPWNAQRFDPADAALFHFHELRTMTLTKVRLGHYRIPQPTIDLIYRPYLADLSAALAALRTVGVVPPMQRPSRGAWAEFKDWLALRALDRRQPRSPLTMRIPRAGASIPE